MVQIHSPRPTIKATYMHKNGRGALGPGPGGQWSKRIRPEHSVKSKFDSHTLPPYSTG
jgi:hypothetical protein